MKERGWKQMILKNDDLKAATKKLRKVEKDQDAAYIFAMVSESVH